MSQIDVGRSMHEEAWLFLFSNKIKLKRKYLSDNTQMFFLFS